MKSKEECDKIILWHKGCVAINGREVLDCAECYYCKVIGKLDVRFCEGDSNKIYKYVLMKSNLEEILK
jgi:hypothetical protein